MSFEQPGRPEISGADLPLASSLSRKCSTCGRTGHNSRTCLESREAVAAVPDLANLPTSEQARQQVAEKGRVEDEGAASDDSQGGNQREGRKKGVAWTEEEHRLFLSGLQKLGKGDWRGISRHYVQTRSPTQVASHAQKYFIRQSIAGKRKRRSSLFDLVPDQQPVQEVTSSHVTGQQGKEQQKPPQPAVELPQMAHPPFPGMMPGGGPEALAMAYYYQAMMMQQNPMQWLQAMYGQSQPSQMFIPPPPPPQAVAAMLASGQGFLVPPLLQQGFLGVQQPGTEGSQQTGMSAQNQALASFLAQQQQMAAAFAMSMNPDATLQQSGNPSGNEPVPRLPSRGSVPGAAEQQNNKAYRMGYPREPLPRVSADLTERDGRKTETGQSRANEASGESSLHLTGGRTELQSEAFGYGRLVRPKAQKAQPASGGFGEMPTYMRSSQEPHSYLGSVSAESHETRLRMSNGQLPSGRFATEMSGSTNGCFSLGADEQSATRGSRTTHTRKEPEAPPSRTSERSSPDEVPYGSLAGASFGAGSDESRSMNASPPKAEQLCSVKREFS